MQKRSTSLATVLVLLGTLAQADAAKPAAPRRTMRSAIAAVAIGCVAAVCVAGAASAQSATSRPLRSYPMPDSGGTPGTVPNTGVVVQPRHTTEPHRGTAAPVTTHIIPGHGVTAPVTVTTRGLATSLAIGHDNYVLDHDGAIIRRGIGMGGDVCIGNLRGARGLIEYRGTVLALTERNEAHILSGGQWTKVGTGLRTLVKSGERIIGLTTNGQLVMLTPAARNFQPLTGAQSIGTQPDGSIVIRFTDGTNAVLPPVVR